MGPWVRNPSIIYRRPHLGVEHRDGDPPGPLPGNAPVASVVVMGMMGMMGMLALKGTIIEYGRCTSRLCLQPIDGNGRCVR